MNDTSASFQAAGLAAASMQKEATTCPCTRTGTPQ